MVSGLLEHMDGDFSDFGAADGNMVGQNAPGLLAVLVQYRAQDARVFVIGGADTIFTGEVKAANYADFFRQLAVNARHFTVAHRRHQGDMEGLIVQ